MNKFLLVSLMALGVFQLSAQSSRRAGLKSEIAKHHSEIRRLQHQIAQKETEAALEESRERAAEAEAEKAPRAS